MLTIEIACELPRFRPNRSQLKQAVRLIVEDAGIESAEISIALVSDERMHALNRQYLAHDFPTDVLSFVLAHDAKAKSLEGEIIASADYAAREAIRYGWSTSDELLLYVIHGTLHLVGHDDTNPAAKRKMRVAEKRWLAHFSLEPRRRSAKRA